MHLAGTCWGLAVAVSALLATSPASADPPAPAAAVRAEGQHFTIDPVADGTITVASMGLSYALGAVLGTGEIRPIGTPADPSVLLPIDRGALTKTFDSTASTYSDIGLWVATGFAVLDPFLSWARDGFDAFLVDAVMYAESGAITSAMTSVFKIAIRRPRPIDYENPSATDTNVILSFPSGHASGVASVGATATYLAFVRSPRTARPWITLAASVLLAGFVDYERVRTGAHFPTDVAAGTLLGGTVGVLVPHLHRHADEPPLWVVGFGPSPDGTGGGVTLRTAL
jgi:undecaprenyl-diphosphatase